MWPVDFAFHWGPRVGCGWLGAGMGVRVEHTSVPLARVVSLWRHRLVNSRVPAGQGSRTDGFLHSQKSYLHFTDKMQAISGSSFNFQALPAHKNVYIYPRLYLWLAVLSSLLLGLI